MRFDLCLDLSWPIHHTQNSINHLNESYRVMNEWTPCAHPQKGDIIKWREPIWAPPNKPRGKRDKIGEQQITATVMDTDEVISLTVLAVTKLSSGDAAVQVQKGDTIRRKQKSIALGHPEKKTA